MKENARRLFHLWFVQYRFKSLREDEKFLGRGINSS